MGVFVILEMDGSTDDLLAAAADLEGRRPTPAILSRVIAPSDAGVVVATFWESAEARDAYQAQPEHREAPPGERHARRGEGDAIPCLQRRRTDADVTAVEISHRQSDAGARVSKWVEGLAKGISLTRWCCWWESR